MPQKESELVSLRTGDSDEEEEHLIQKFNPVVRPLTDNDVLMESSTLDDILAAVNEAKFIGPMISLLVLLVGMYMATDVFRPHQHRTPRLSHNEFVSTVFSNQVKRVKK